MYYYLSFIINNVKRIVLNKLWHTISNKCPNLRLWLEKRDLGLATFRSTFELGLKLIPCQNKCLNHSPNRKLTSNSSCSCFNIFSTSEKSLIDPPRPSNCIVFKQFATSVNNVMPFIYTLKQGEKGNFNAWNV